MIVGALEIQMMADLARLRRDMSEVNSITTRAADTAALMASRIQAAFAALGVGAAVKQFVEVADNMALMEARVKIATKTTEDFNAAQKSIYEISQRNLTSLDSTTKVFARLNPVVEKLGGDVKYTAAVSEALAAALRVSGASTQEASSVMIQFSQAMSSGALRGEEFNSVSENGSRVLDALSNQLGKNRGELRKMAEQGQLTAAVVGNALVKELKKLQEEAKSMPLTVGGAFQRLQNDLAVYVNGVNKSYGITKTLAEGLEFLRKNLDAVSAALITGAKVAAAYFLIFRGGPLVISALTLAFNGLVGAMATFVTGGVLASGTATAMTGIWATLTTGTFTLTTAVTGLQLAMGVIFAAFAGWEIGTWARENFLEVELFGLAMVTGLLKGFQYIKYAWDVAVASIVWAWEKAMGSVQAVFAWFLKAFADGLSKLGLTEQSKQVLEWAGMYQEAADSVGTLTDRLKPLNEAHEKELLQITTITDEMADYAIEQHAAKKAVEQTTGAVKALNQTTKDEKAAKEAAAKAAKELKKAQDELEHATKLLVDTILDEADAILKANAAAQKQIDDIRFETEALKMTNTEREIAIELRKLEQNGIEKGTEAYEEYAKAIRKAVLDRADVEESIKLAKDQSDELKKLNDEIGQGLTDSLFRAFESGKGFFTTLWDGIKNTFKTTVLKMLIQPVQQGIGNVVGGFISNLLGGGSGAAGGSGGGLGSLLSMGSSLYSIGSGWLGGSMSGANAAGSLYANMTGTGLDGLLATNGAYGTAGTGASASGMSMSTLGWVAAIVAGVMKASSDYDEGFNTYGATNFNKQVFGGSFGPETFRASLLSKLGVSDKWASILSGSTAVAKIFGRAAPRIVESGAEGAFSAGDFSGRAYAEIHEKGGLFRKTKAYTEYQQLPKELADALSKGGKAVLDKVKDYADALGMPTSALMLVTSKARFKLGDDAKANEEAVMAVLTTYKDALLSTFSETIKPFVKAGESIEQTLERLITLDKFARTINDLGGVFSRVALLGYDAREAIIGMAGGLEAFNSKSSNFVKDYYSQNEQAGLQAKGLLSYFQSAGIDISGVNSREQFRALVESLDVSTEAGQKQLVALLDIAPQFAQVADYLKEQKTTLADLAAQAPATAALQSFNDRQVDYQATLDRNIEVNEEAKRITEEGFSDLQESFNNGLAQLNGSINRLNNFFAAWDNGDSLSVSTV